MSQPAGLVYEASVYTRTVDYKNFKGEVRSVPLYFALDPISLLEVIATFQPKKNKRSGNPARQNEDVEISNEEQVKFFRDLCSKAAGEPTKDGEAWTPFPDFNETLAGKAFLTKLASSDVDRKEFAEKVLLAPFRSFVDFASNDPGNTQSEVEQFKKMLTQLENVFNTKAPENETFEQKRERLAAELAAMNDTPAGE